MSPIGRLLLENADLENNVLLIPSGSTIDRRLVQEWFRSVQELSD
jgi:hypothetical protein